MGGVWVFALIRDVWHALRGHTEPPPETTKVLSQPDGSTVLVAWNDGNPTVISDR